MKRFYLTPDQQKVLSEQMQEVAAELVSVTFVDPADDQAAIRRAIYLRGRLDAYAFVGNDEFPEPATDLEPQTGE